MSEESIAIPFMTRQMRLCGKAHENGVSEGMGRVEDRINRLLDAYWGVTTMARNNQKDYPSKRNWDMEFLNRKLTEEQKEEFRTWVSDADRSDVMLTKTFHEGYKASVLWMSEQKVFNATLYPAKDAEMNAGMAISSKSSNWYTAVMMCVFKHLVICKGDWSRLRDSDGDEG